MKIIPACLHIHGIRLLNLSMQDTLSALEAALEQHVPTQVSFVNADCVNIAANNEQYRQHLAQSDWVFIDGSGMRIAGKILHQPVCANVNGTDLFPLLCQILVAHGHSLYLLGARPGIAEQVVQWVQLHYPKIRIAGSQHGYYEREYEAEVVADIRASGAEVLLVAMGAPHQEAWIARNLAASGATLALGVGGLFDFYSGRIPRAPHWMRRMGMEWLYRLYQEPKRLWRRYVVGNVAFLARTLWKRGSMIAPFFNTNKH